MFCYTGFLRTSIIAEFVHSGPVLRLDLLNSLRGLERGKEAVPLQCAEVPLGWSILLFVSSQAAVCLSSSMLHWSSVGRDERLHVGGRGAFTSSRISSLDLWTLSVSREDLTVSSPTLPGTLSIKPAGQVLNKIVLPVGAFDSGE